MHDPSWTATNGQGKVEDMSVLELRELDAGQGEQVPILSEVLEFVDWKIVWSSKLRSLE
jgi:glycerophosphoryl diester phosphodiesterase